MQIITVESDNRRAVRRFLQLPQRLYRADPHWVPPLAGEVRQALNPNQHPFYEHSQAIFLLAQEGQRAVGRLAVLNNRRYNQHYDASEAFFTLFECERNSAVAEALFDAGKEWAVKQGLRSIRGPKGMSVLDGLGLLVKGFKHRPALGIPYNPPHYADLLEACGFTPYEDVVSGYLPRKVSFPPRIHRIAELVKRRRGLEVRRFTSRGELRSIVPQFRALYNRSLALIPGNVPLTARETESLAEQLIAIADPNLIKIVTKGKQPVGFLLAYPDISAALQRCGGRVWPLGWLHLLREKRRTRWLNINGMGIAKEYQGLGGTAVLFSELQKTVQESRFEHAEIVQIRSTNDKMQREMENLGIDFYKTHRLYRQAF